MAELIIRAQEPEDAAAVGRLLLQPGVFPTTLQVPYTPLAARRDSGPPSPDDHRLVAELGGRVVGSLTLRVHPRARRRHAADLGIVPIVVTDACAGGHADAAERSLESLRFAGDAILTDSATFRAALAKSGGAPR